MHPDRKAPKVVSQVQRRPAGRRCEAPGRNSTLAGSAYDGGMTAMPSSGSPGTAERCDRFRALHASSCFVLPNPWDRGSAMALEQIGFKALATTSAGFAFACGRPDTVDAVPRDLMLAHIADLVAATSLPVHADFLNGYADAPEEVGANVALCVAAGVAGLSIEDATGDPQAPLYPFPLAVERVRAARAAIDQSGLGVQLTARCEAWLVADPEPARTARARLVAFAEAGADCLHAPGVRDLDTIAEMVQAVAPRALNVLVSAPHPDLTLARLGALGVRRISVGSALARVAWGAFLRSARAIAETGTFEPLASAVPFAELNALFRQR